MPVTFTPGPREGGSGTFPKDRSPHQHRITHLRDVLGDQTYESLARKG